MNCRDPRLQRLISLGHAAWFAPAGARRRATAIAAGAVCHGLFAAAIMSMIYGMYHGLSRSVGDLDLPWAIAANTALLLQFPIVHSLLLTGTGMRFLSRLVPGAYGKPLGTTVYVIIASLQLLALFWLWTPSGIVWWRAEGVGLVATLLFYTLLWLFLAKAIFDAGADLQSGALGWLSLLADKAPRFPDMPTLGLFRVIRQPIYLAFACTLWTVPTWTPDQLALAVAWTTYCIAAPIHKERRLQKRHGRRFQRYREQVPYMIPGKPKELCRDVHTP